MNPVLICIPTYNEIENLGPILKAVLAVTPDRVHVLVIDDGSPDGTGAAAERWSETESRVHVLHRTQKQGLGPAYCAGFRWAMDHQKISFESVIQMDADFSHEPKYLPVMLNLLDSYDGVIGSRNIPGGGTVNWGIVRKIISRGGSWYARTLLGAPLRDFTGGFNGWKLNVLRAINLDTMEAGGYSFQIELKYRAYKHGFKLKEFPIVFEDRRVGKSKMSSKIVVEALALVPRLRLKNQT